MGEAVKCEFPVITTTSGFTDGPMYACVGPGKWDREKQSNGAVRFEWPKPTAEPEADVVVTFSFSNAQWVTVTGTLPKDDPPQVMEGELTVTDASDDFAWAKERKLLARDQEPQALVDRGSLGRARWIAETVSIVSASSGRLSSR